MKSSALLVLCGLLLAARAQADVSAAQDFPKQGTATTVTVTDADGAPLPGAQVTAVYRPGSNVAHTEMLGTTGADGTVAWTPDDAGLVALQATPAATPEAPEPAMMTTNLSVIYRGVPLPGLLVLLVAGITLYGGVIWGFAKLSGPPALPPDT